MINKHFEEILRKSKRLAIPAVEKNIFSIGGRGHYENPISDLLAFFLDIREVHGFGDLVLKSINEAAKLPTKDTDIIAPPQREVRTNDEKRIDILVEGEDYVTIIENKIRHHCAANPFDSYRAFLNEYYKGKKQNLVLLSVRKEIPPLGWSSLTYKELLLSIKKNIGEYVVKIQYSKWLILFREFLINIEQECETDPMTNDRFEFVYKNYQALRELQKIVDEYIKELHEKGLDAIRKAIGLESSDLFRKQENWGDEGTALRLHFKRWGDRSNITLLLRPDGSFRVQFYVYSILESEVSNLRAAVDDEKYKTFWTEQNTIRCFGFYDSSDLDAILKEIEEVAKMLTTYYCGTSPGVGLSNA